MKKIQKPLFVTAMIIGLFAVSLKATTGTQYNWGTSTGANWYTPDETAVMDGQVLTISGNATPRVVSSTNVAIPGTLTVAGVTTLTSSITVKGSISIPPANGLTIAQLSALTPATTGQIVFCTNCVNTLLVISTGSTVGGQWAGVFASSLAIPSAVK